MKYFISAVIILFFAFFVIDSALSEKSEEVVGTWGSDEITISFDQVQLDRHGEKMFLVLDFGIATPDGPLKMSLVAVELTDSGKTVLEKTHFARKRLFTGSTEYDYYTLTIQKDSLLQRLF